MAILVMQLLKMQRDAVGLSIFSDKLDTNTPARSSSVHHKLLYHKMEEAIASANVKEDICPNIFISTSAFFYKRMSENL